MGTEYGVRSIIYIGGGGLKVGGWIWGMGGGGGLGMVWAWEWVLRWASSWVGSWASSEGVSAMYERGDHLGVAGALSMYVVFVYSWCVVYIRILYLYIQTDGTTEHHEESSFNMNSFRTRFLSCTPCRGVRLYVCCA